MLELTAERREIFGKKLTNARALGRLPVVVYGPKNQPESFFVDIKAFKKVFQVAGESAIVSFKDGKTEHEVLIHDVAWHPITSEPLHADFYAVEKGKKLRVQVPLDFVGLAPAVKELGATLVKVRHELEAEALPKDLPAHLAVDVSTLTTLEAQVLVRDIKLPAGVEIINKPEEVVAAVAAVVEEKEEVVPVDLAAIEVEKKGKKEEEGEGAVGEATPAAESKTAKPTKAKEK